MDEHRDGQERRVMVTVLGLCAAAVAGLALIVASLIDQHGAAWWQALTARHASGPAGRAVESDGARPDQPVVPAVDRGQAGASLRGNPGRFFGPDAYPAEAVREGAQGRTVARLAVDARGVPVGCTVETSSGWRSLDAATCAIAIGRVRYRPARDAQGRPIAATTRLPVRWVLPG